MAFACLVMACVPSPGTSPTATPTPALSVPVVAPGVGPPSPAAGGPDASLEPGPSIDPAIAYAISQRRQFGLRSDLDWVLQVAADPRATMDPLDFLMLPEEAAEFQRLQADFDSVVQAVQAYGDAHRAEFGGVWLDQERHTVVSAWTSNAALHRIAILATLGKAGPLEVRLVRYSEAELRALQERMTDDRDWLATIPAAMTFSSVDITANRAELGISSANPQAAALIMAHYGVGADKLRVISDGTGILLLPRGTVHGHIVRADGRAPGANEWNLNWSPDRPTDGECGSEVGFGVSEDGVFDLPCAPGGWTISVQAPVADGWVDIGKAHVVVPAGGDVELSITVDPAAVPSP